MEIVFWTQKLIIKALALKSPVSVRITGIKLMDIGEIMRPTAREESSMKCYMNVALNLFPFYKGLIFLGFYLKYLTFLV